MISVITYTIDFAIFGRRLRNCGTIHWHHSHLVLLTLKSASWNPSWENYERVNWVTDNVCWQRRKVSQRCVMFLRQMIKFSNDVYGYIGMPLRRVYISLYAFIIIKRRRYDLEKPFNDVSFYSIFAIERHMKNTWRRTKYSLLIEIRKKCEYNINHIHL